MATGYDERYRVINISGEEKDFPFLPYGNSLAASGYTDVKAAEFHEMTYGDREGLKAAIDNDYVSIERVPLTDPTNRVAEEKTVRVNWPISGEQVDTTGAQAYFYNPSDGYGKVAPGQLKLVGGEVHFSSGEISTYVGATEREVALQVDGVVVSNWINAAASGPDAAMSAAGQWEAGRALGDVIPFNNLQATGTTITAGSKASLYLTGYVNAAKFSTGLTGSAMIRVVPNK